MQCTFINVGLYIWSGNKHDVHSIAQAVFAMAPKGAFTLERLNGLGEGSCKAALNTLSDGEANVLTHLSCQYPALICMLVLHLYHAALQFFVQNMEVNIQVHRSWFRGWLRLGGESVMEDDYWFPMASSRFQL